MSELMIRPIREEDVSQIHEIEKACFADAVVGGIHPARCEGKRRGALAGFG